MSNSTKVNRLRTISGILCAVATISVAGCYTEVEPSEESSGTTGISTVITSSTTSASTMIDLPESTGSSSGSFDTSTTGGVICGDGVVAGDEVCDDGNQEDGDACTNACAWAICGDGIVGPGEACDGESDDCTDECVLTSCGDGVVQESEACDDGVATVMCDEDCTWAECGDGEPNLAAGEECDDGDLKAGDACSSACVSTEIEHLAVGGNFVCVAFKGGAVRCWGQGEYGAPGQGNPDDRGNNPDELPMAEVPLGGPVVDLASGLHHVCAVLATGEVQCWGYNVQGQLGNGTTGGFVGAWPGDMPPTVVVMEDEAKAVQVAAGQLHTCAIMEGGGVRCWGTSPNGGLGYGVSTVRNTANEDVKNISGVTQLALGINFTCALQQNGAVRCWGYNSVGQLGRENVAGISTPPIEAIKLGGIAVKISAGSSHACALMQDGKVRCWGEGTYTALGNGMPGHVGTTPGSMPPPPVVMMDGSLASGVAAGSVHTCAVLISGDVRCWGWGTYGSLGYGDGKKYPTPPNEAVNLGGEAIEMLDSSVGAYSTDFGYTTCAVRKDDRSMRCWGNNTYGQLGLGDVKTIGDDETPVDAVVPY